MEVKSRKAGRARTAKDLAGAGVLALALATAAHGGAHATQAKTGPGPFDVLEWKDGVRTARSGYAVWITIRSVRHEMQIRGHDTTVKSPRHRFALNVSCRVPGSPLPDMFPAYGPRGELWFDDHPEQREAYTANEPMYWWLGLTGRETEQWSVQVQLNEQPPTQGTAIRPLTDYNVARPAVYIDVPGTKVLDAILAGDTIALHVRGEGTRLRGEFAVKANVRRAAELMRKTCK